MFDALLLDVYGTLVAEDDAVIAKTASRVAVGAGRPELAREVAETWSQLFVATCGQAVADSFVTQREAVCDSLKRTMEAYNAQGDIGDLVAEQFNHWRTASLFEDAVRFLGSVSLPICLVSNIDRDDLDALLAHHGIEVVGVITSEDVRSYKPRPEMFMAALDLLGVSPLRVLHIGDSVGSDVFGANGVGIPVAWVNRSGRQLPSGFTVWGQPSDLDQLSQALQ